jgi:glycosyltransferase involved in cell wall biosynthesis
VVDDCSTDDGPSIAKGLIARVPGAQLVHMSSNAGPATARNAGARIAMGSHLLFFDADDVPSPKLLDTLRDVISQCPDDAVFTYGIAFQARGENLKYPRHGVACTLQRRHQHAFVADSLLGRTLCTASSTCVKRTTFLDVGGFQEGLRYCEDPELWARLSAHYEVVAIKDVLALYRDVPQSLSYEWRGRIGAVNPYVDSLILLYQAHGGPYRALARSLVFKNLVFARAAGVRQRDVSSQLKFYRALLGPFHNLALNVLNFVPSGLLGRLLATGAKRRIRRVSSSTSGLSL